MKSATQSNFRKFVTESGNMLDVSIQSADKYLTSLKRKVEFLSAETEIQQKTDGVKLTVVRVNDKGTIDDWIFSYKGNILYKEEFDFQPKIRAKEDSIGSSQFKLAIDHFKTLGQTNIPVNTELFIEYLMRKPTLSSDYRTLHKMVLIGYSISEFSTSFGKLKTRNSGLQTELREAYAKELKIDTPVVLFKGILGTKVDFEKGIISTKLKDLFLSEQNSMTWDNPEILLDDIKALLLSVESKYGGLEEGVVLIQPDKTLKFQQEYQLDPLARKQIKLKYCHDSPEKEAEYWESVKAFALVLTKKVGTGSQKDIPDLMLSLSRELKYSVINIEHPKKAISNIKDDIQLTAKIQLIKELKGNNNCLVVGKFRVLTSGHVKMIKRASRKFDNVVICIVSNKENIETRELRTKMIKSVFPECDVVHHNSGNLISIINKSPININNVYAGSDRVSEYVKQLQRSSGIGVSEMPRTQESISATKIIDNIEDQNYFNKNTPKEIHQFYDEIFKTYNET